MNKIFANARFQSVHRLALAATTAVGLLSASSAMGAEPDSQTPFDSWTGVYGGVAVGAGASSTTLNANLNPVIPVTASLDGIAAEGLLWSATLGFDYQISPRWVVGGMLDYTGSSIESTLGGNIPGTGSARYDLTADHAVALLGRVGYLTGPDTLVYALAGGTWQYYTGELRGRDIFGNPLPGLSYEFDTGRLTVGTGIENRLGNGLSVKLEYRYTDFEDGDVIPNALTAEINTHTMRLGLNYKYGIDAGSAPAAPSIAYDWTGFIIGVEGGYGTNVTSFDLDAAPIVFGDFTGLSAEGGTIGVRLGYDHQLNDSWVLGVQGSARLSNMDLEANLNVDGDTGGASIEEQYQFSLTGRVGYLTTPDTMWYALAGYQWSSVDVNVVGGTLAEVDREGIVLGLGVETALTENLTFGLEYRYVDYDEFDLVGGGLAEALTSSHSAMVSLNYKLRP